MTNPLSENQQQFLTPHSQQFFKENLNKPVDKLLLSTKSDHELPIHEIAHQISCRNKFKNKQPNGVLIH